MALAQNVVLMQLSAAFLKIVATFWLAQMLTGKTLNDCTFNATRTAWVLDLSPTVAEPCFTASMAYSI